MTKHALRPQPFASHHSASRAPSVKSSPRRLLAATLVRISQRRRLTFPNCCVGDRSLLPPAWQAERR